MLTLIQSQANFIDTINQGPAALDPTLFGGAQDRVLLGLKAHANTISHARLIAIEDSFPRTRAAMGDADFNAYSRDYCETDIARASDNNHIGNGFIGFLTEKDVAPEYIDLARIEWAWLESYHSADAPSLCLADLATLDEERLLSLGITPHPAARLIVLQTANFKLIEELGSVTADAILMTRPDAEVRLLAVDEITAAIFNAAHKNTALCNLLEIATEHGDNSNPLEPIIALIGAGAFLKTKE